MRSTSASSAGSRPSSSSAAGRSSVIRLCRPRIVRSSWSTASCDAAVDAARAPGSGARGLEQHLQRAELLQRLVVQLARPALALLLGGSHRVTQALGLDRLRRRDRDRGARRERGQQVLVVGVEGRPSPIRSSATSTPRALPRKPSGTTSAERASPTTASSPWPSPRRRARPAAGALRCRARSRRACPRAAARSRRRSRSISPAAAATRSAPLLVEQDEQRAAPRPSRARA